jgi:hypothetical protein
MKNKNTIMELSKIEDEILDIIENADEFTTSDLQGCIQAQVLNAYELGRKEGSE